MYRNREIRSTEKMVDHRIRGEIGRAIKNLLPCNNKNNIVVGHRWTMEDGTREGVLVYHGRLVNQGCEARGQSKQGARRDTIYEASYRYGAFKFS